jgi:lysophospholipase L1-like esterase
VSFTVTRKDGRPCKGPLGLTADKAVSFGSDGGCSFHATYREEGTYTVSVSLTDCGKKLEGKRTFVVQDWLIVGLGDSNGSGEGAPDIPAEIGSHPARWQDRQCHRSANSYQAQTARSLERRDPRTSVTFVHLACSGATMLKGLLLEYEGIDPAAGDDLPPQIKEMKRLVGDREVDAVVISIGVNDLKFGTMVGHCIGNDDCPNVEFPEATSPRTLTQEIVRLLRLLPNRYAKVGAALEGVGVKPGRVFLSEYFDSTRDDKGEFCDPLIYVPGLGTFDRTEAKWAHDRVLVKLNEAVVAAAKAQEWGGTIRGAYLSFRQHGYCAKDTWIVSLTDSASTQFNKEGTLHSTPRGNTEQAKDATLVLRQAFYPGGRTRAPRG